MFVDRWDPGIDGSPREKGVGFAAVHVFGNRKNNDIVVHFVGLDREGEGRRNRLTLHLEFDSTIPILARLTEDEADYCTRSSEAIISLSCAVPTAGMACPCCAHQHATLKGGID